MAGWRWYCDCPGKRHAPGMEYCEDCGYKPRPASPDQASNDIAAEVPELDVECLKRTLRALVGQEDLDPWLRYK